MKNLPYIAGVIGVALWSTSLYFALTSLQNLEMASLGQFGDTFGAVNALFTMLAMIGAAIAVSFQHFELREAQQRNQDEQEERKRNETEQRFYQLLGLLNESMRHTQVLGLNQEKQFVSGQRAFDYAAYYTIEPVENRVEVSRAGCEQWTRTVSVVLDFVDKTLDQSQRQFFSRVLQSQLTLSQLILLARTADPTMSILLTKLGMWHDASAEDTTRLKAVLGIAYGGPFFM